MPDWLQLGAPGVYELPSRQVRELVGARMDVCAFVGVAPRGPARVPLVDEQYRDDGPTVAPDRPRLRSVAVPVESWDDYRRLYGGFEGPGRLPYAVSAFFDQGGRRAYVVRILHDYADPTLDAGGVASAALAPLAVSGGGRVLLHARNEGSWGNRLRADLGYRTRPLEFDDGLSTSVVLVLALDSAVATGELLRFRLDGGSRVLRFAADVRDEGRANGPAWARYVTLDSPLPAAAKAVEAVDAWLEADDGDGRAERLEGLGLSSAHDRYLPTVLCRESELLWPDAALIDRDLEPTVDLQPARSEPFGGGEDRYPEIVPSDFFDVGWSPGGSTDPEATPLSGVYSLVGVPDVSLLVVPDLYEPSPVEPVESVVGPVTFAGPDFATCVEPPAAGLQTLPAPPLAGLMRDPEGDLPEIIDLQRQLVELADELESLVVLLDVPPGLRKRELLRWRSRFASSYAAAYHPWVLVTRLAHQPESPVMLNPAAVAAGIIARRELLYGVPYGPANELAAGVVDVLEHVAAPVHDELHRSNVNVFVRERDGVRLTAARTLSRDPAWRQLSVRRLLTMLCRTLEQEMLWTVFEPNGPALREDVRFLLEGLLRRLWRGNAFAGATEEQAYFVRCDDDLNPPQVVDAGELIVEIGVAPAEPLEFIVLRVARGGDGTLRVEGGNG